MIDRILQLVTLQRFNPVETPQHNILGSRWKTLNDQSQQNDSSERDEGNGC